MPTSMLTKFPWGNTGLYCCSGFLPFCIRVCHLAGVFVDKLKKKLERYKKNGTLNNFEEHKKKFEMDENEEQCIRIAALCHDLGKIKTLHFNYTFTKLMC